MRKRRVKQSIRALAWAPAQSDSLAGPGSRRAGTWVAGGAAGSALCVCSGRAGEAALACSRALSVTSTEGSVGMFVAGAGGVPSGG